MSKVTIYSPPATAQIKHCAVDFDLRREPVPIHLVQYDKTLPILEVSLYKGSVPYRLPDDAEANVRMGKFNNRVIYNPVLGCGENRDKVYIAVTQQMTTQEGDFYPIVEVLVDGGVAGTSSMRLVVHRNPAQEDAIEDSSEAKSLDELVKQAAASAESARNDAEIAKQAEQTVEANAGNIQAVVDNLDAIKAAPGQAKAAAASAAAAQQAAQEALGFRTFFSAVTPDENGDLDPSRPMTTPTAASVTVKSKGDRIQSVKLFNPTAVLLKGKSIDGSVTKFISTLNPLTKSREFRVNIYDVNLSSVLLSNKIKTVSTTWNVDETFICAISGTAGVYTIAIRLPVSWTLEQANEWAVKENIIFWYKSTNTNENSLFTPVFLTGHEYRCQCMPVSEELVAGDKVESNVPSGCDKRIVLDGSIDESWSLSSSSVTGYIRAVYSIPEQNAVQDSAISDIYRNALYSEWSAVSASAGSFVSVTSFAIVVQVKTNLPNTIENFKTILQENPLTVWYRSTAYTEANDIPVQLETHANGHTYAHDPVTIVAIPYTQADVDAANQLANTPSTLPAIDSPDVPMLLNSADNTDSAAQVMALAANAVPVAGTYVVSSQDGTTLAVSLKAMQDGGNAATLGGQNAAQIIQSAKPGTSTVYTSTNTIAAGLYDFTSAITAPCLLSIMVQREGKNITDNVVLFTGDSVSVAVKCSPNDNTGVEMYSNITITSTGVTFGDWYCGFEYQGSLSQSLCTGLTVRALAF